MTTDRANAASESERVTGHKDGCPYLFFDQGECTCGEEPASPVGTPHSEAATRRRERAAATSRDRAPAAYWDEWLRLFANRDEVAEEYADVLRSTGVDWGGWREFNAAILRRWSPAGLRYIKEKAWKLAKT